MAFKIQIGGTVGQPTINVSGENREPATWEHPAPWGVSWGQMAEMIGIDSYHRATCGFAPA